MSIRLPVLLALLSIACNDGAGAADAAVDATPKCPALQPAGPGQDNVSCPDKSAVCSYGNVVCQCGPGPVAGNVWSCQDPRCPGAGFPTGACTVQGLGCGGGFENPFCVCTMVCSTLWWVCSGFPIDMSMHLPGDMCP